ncbi:MAG: hypothetical protein ACFCVH_02485 [Alphaproteobacteria bacterium]
MTLERGRGLARSSIFALLPFVALAVTPGAGAQTADPERSNGPPAMPAREFVDPGAATDPEIPGDAQSGQVGADEGQPIGPPAMPTREYLEAAGFGAPPEAPSGRAEVVEASPDAAVDAATPDPSGADPTAALDPSIEGPPDPTGDGADAPAVLSELVEALPEELANGGEAGPEGGVNAFTEGLPEQVIEGEAADLPAMQNDALDVLPDAIAGQAGDVVPQDVLADEPTEIAAADVPEPAVPQPAVPEPAVPDVQGAPQQGGAAASGAGQIVFEAFDVEELATRLYRIPARAGETPEDVSAALDVIGAGQDNWITLSPDGGWLLLGTQRFDPTCSGWPCLAVAPADLSAVEVIRSGLDPVHPTGRGAVASGGGLIVFPGTGGPHDTDLWAVTRAGDAWSDPLLITGASPFTYNETPAIDPTGERLVFDCGDAPIGLGGTAICEIGTDGSGFRVVITPQDAPGGVEPGGAHHNAAYAPDGSIVFESQWGYSLWRLAEGGSPEPVSPTFDGDSGPCVLADGRIASLWPRRPESGGNYELKVMTPDGAFYAMLLTDVHIDDIGCGG